MIEQQRLSHNKSPMPKGMRWLRKDCRDRGGFFVETEHHMVSYSPGAGRLVVCFDNLASSRETEQRVPFGFALAVGQGWAVLGVMVKRKDWFQCPDLKARLFELQEKGLFDQYPDVSFYGSSMGGFGAMAFAPLAKNPTVLAIAPQSTLRPRRVKFERRYVKQMRRGDWSGDFTDVAGQVDKIGKAYVLFDPEVPQDRLHYERIAAPNVIGLPVRHFTHKVPPHAQTHGGVETCRA